MIALDSATNLDAAKHAGDVAVTASHGGAYCAYLAAKARVRAVLFNDAGVGLDRAGIASLPILERYGIAAACIDHRSARIGDVADELRRGRISFLNDVARACDVREEMLVSEAVERLQTAPLVTPDYEAYGESRFLFADDTVSVWGIDSVSLVRDDDAGAIVVTGSHGGILGGRPETALRVGAIAAVFNDAGIGIDDAGTTRLPALDARGIAAVTVAAMTARIGDARSAWETGRLSVVNETARKRGARVEMSVPGFCALFR